EKPTRQSEGIQLVGVNYFDGERHLRVRVAYQILPYAVHILGDRRIVDQLGASFHILRIRPPHRHLFVQRVPVAHALFATHVAIADGVNVVHRIRGGSSLVRLIRGILTLTRVLSLSSILTWTRPALTRNTRARGTGIARTRTLSQTGRNQHECEDRTREGIKYRTHGVHLPGPKTEDPRQHGPLPP